MDLKTLLSGGVVVGLAAIFAGPSADRDETGAIITEGNVDIFQIQLGDCFNDSSTYNTDETVELMNVGGIPCSNPHDNEVYARTLMTDDAYPGEKKVLKVAEDYCFAQFESYVGAPYETSILDITYIYPTAESWMQMNDKEILCALYDMDLNKLVGSVRGRGI